MGGDGSTNRQSSITQNGEKGIVGERTPKTRAPSQSPGVAQNAERGKKKWSVRPARERGTKSHRASKTPSNLLLPKTHRNQIVKGRKRKKPNEATRTLNCDQQSDEGGLSPGKKWRRLHPLKWGKGRGPPNLKVGEQLNNRIPGLLLRQWVVSK